jgi:UDP:flavonoid glycosyltransferase YjiC (YdhE family)
MPLAYDQADNAVRMRRHGVARLLYPKRFTGPAVAKCLKSILGDEGIKRAARGVSERFAGVDPVATTCALLEGLIGRPLGVPGSQADSAHEGRT